MSLPPRALQVGSLIQPNYVFNPGAPVFRDLCMLYYDQPYFRDIDVRRVFVIDPDTNHTLITTPMRVMAAWWARHRSSSQDNAPFLSISGWQPSIPDDIAGRYLQTLASAKGGGVVLAGGMATFRARCVSTGEEGQGEVETVLKGVKVKDMSWVRMFVENMSGVDAGTAYIKDKLDFDANNEGDVVMMLREEETDVAMGSPMTLTEAEGRLREGIQFRGGYGAKWDDEAPAVELKHPLYSPMHRGPAPNRIWVFGKRGE